MTTNPGDAAVRIRRELRTRLRNGAETVTLAAADAHLLLEEVGRLQQANDRLRRQNRRVRKRLQAATGKAVPDDDVDDQALVDEGGQDAVDDELGFASDDAEA